MVIGLLELPYHATSLKTPLPTRPPFTLGDYLRVAVGDRPAKSLKGLCRMTNLCGVSHGQMAKVEQREVRRIVQPVEKVVVGSVCSARGVENEDKTLQERRIRLLNRQQKRARKSFSTG